jgi:hypothetical protein
MRVRTAVSVVAVAVGLRAITALVRALIERFKNVDKYEGLDSVVSFSSRMIAGGRHAPLQLLLAHPASDVAVSDHSLTRQRKMRAA